jgi:hypothetical protein
MWLRGTPLHTRIRKLSTRWPSLEESTSTEAALLKSFILFMICALLPLRDGCLYMRRCGFSPPDKTGYPVPGSDAADGEGRRSVQEPEAAKAVGYPTSEIN